MTTYILRTGGEVAVPAAPLVAQVRAGDAAVEHRWSVRGTDSEPPFIERPDRIVLPSITQPVTLRILPAGAVVGSLPRFGPQSVITVVIRHDRSAPDTDQVILDEVDVSGLTHRDLIQLVPDGRQIRVIGLRTAADTPLPPVAEIARDAAREILGVPQVEADRAIGLAARIDLSASMRPAVTDGSAVAACEVLAGVGTVISPGRQLTASAGGLNSRPLAAAAPDRFGAEVGSALASGDAGWGTGFRSTLASGPAATSAHLRTIVITSGVPADWGRQAQLSDHQPLLMILGAAGRSADWPGAGSATVVDRGGLIARPPDRETINAAVDSLLAAIGPNAEATR